VIIANMKDLPALFKAFVIPYFTCASFTGVVFQIATGQEASIILWGIAGAGLSKMGIDFGIGKIKKK